MRGGAAGVREELRTTQPSTAEQEKWPQRLCSLEVALNDTSWLSLCPRGVNICQHHWDHLTLFKINSPNGQIIAVIQT